MTKVPRRSLSELVGLHELETSLRDIFVEGEYDQAVVSSFLCNVGNTNVVVRTINCIEVDDLSLRCRGRDVGNRERVLYLAKYAEKVSMPAGKILCIADRDFDDWIGPPPNFRDLVLTDYTCMDAYVWNCTVMRRFLTIYCNRPSWQPNQFMAALREPLKSMFAIRLAARSLGMHLTWLDRPRCVSLSGWKISFDVREFVSRLLHRNSATGDFDLFWARVERFRVARVEDARRVIHADDLVLLTAYLLKRKGVTKVATDRRTVKRVMATCVTVDDIQHEVLFRRIVEFSGGVV